MSKEEIKLEINKVLDNFPDNALNDLLAFLRELDLKRDTLLNNNILEKIFQEDNDLLIKLAK